SFTFEIKFLFALFLIAGALLPDIDNPNTTLGRKHKHISNMTAHRGILHAIWIPLIAFLLAFRMDGPLLLIKAPLMGLAVGYFSHIIADTATLVG
ncbi:unnamed protein product, partial [marine sediment metagenome]